MNKLKISLVTAIFAVMAFAVSHSIFATTTISNARVGKDQGAARMYIASGGQMDVESGGFIDIQSGGALKIAGTTMSSTATELNYIHSVTPGTSAASKAVVLDSNSKIDALDVTSLSINGVAASTAGAVQSFCITGSCTETASTNAGALSVTKFQSLISSAGAETRTLAAPGSNGLMKLIAMTVHVGDVTLAGTNIWGQTAATCTFAAVGDSIVLMAVGGKWLILGQNGATCA